LDDIFNGLADVLGGAGGSLMGLAATVWNKASEFAISYSQLNPAAISGWSTMDNWYDNIFVGIGVALMVLYFVAGWLKESIDIRNSFALDGMFRFFIRIIITATLITNSFHLIYELLQAGTSLAIAVGTEPATIDSSNVAANFSTIVAAAREAGGALDGLKVGVVQLVLGLVGFFAIVITAGVVILSVAGHFFKLFMLIPFAPAALASFAGGERLSHSAVSWIKNFLSRALEIVVVVMALTLATSMGAKLSTKICNQDLTLLETYDNLAAHAQTAYNDAYEHEYQQATREFNGETAAREEIKNDIVILSKYRGIPGLSAEEKIKSYALKAANKAYKAAIAKIDDAKATISENAFTYTLQIIAALVLPMLLAASAVKASEQITRQALGLQ